MNGEILKSRLPAFRTSGPARDRGCPESAAFFVCGPLPWLEEVRRIIRCTVKPSVSRFAFVSVALDFGSAARAHAFVPPGPRRNKGQCFHRAAPAPAPFNFETLHAVRQHWGICSTRRPQASRKKPSRIRKQGISSSCLHRIWVIDPRSD